MYSVTSYRLPVPPPINEEAYHHFKRLLQTNPNHILVPESKFWKEFPQYKFLLIAFILAIPITYYFGLLNIIWWSILPIIFLWIITGQAQTMRNYYRFLKRRKEHFDHFNKILISAKDFEQFQKLELGWRRTGMVG